MMHFQLMHESLSRFSESFASFLYGLNMNAFCVDFPEAPIPESFRRAKEREEQEQGTYTREWSQGAGTLIKITENGGPETEKGGNGDFDGETTFMYVIDLAVCEDPDRDAFLLTVPRTTDVSFVDNPTASSKATPKARTTGLPSSRVPAPSTRGGASSTRGTAAARGRRAASSATRGRPSGLARARGRAVR